MIRKVVPLGSSHGITLPASWLKWVEQENGKRPTAALIEYNGKLTVSPYFEKADQGFTMSIIRKIATYGSSYAVALPSSWFDWVEKVTGKRPTEVSLEVNGKLTVSAYFGKTENKIEA
jgi:NADH:ubiquinone oxidoreductase subunit